MRITRFSIQNQTHFGVIKNQLIHSLDGDPFTPFEAGTALKPDGKIFPLNEAKLLAPCLPSKVVGVGLNYRPHAQEFNQTPPSTPLIFLKPSTSVIGPDDAIVMPPKWQRVDYEGELGVVMGKKVKFVSEEEALQYVLGYTCLNDVTERQFQKEDGQWTRGKSFDTFAPIGPWIETEIKPDDLKLETYLNAELRQSGRTGELVFSISKLISFISGIMTLLPGDVIATGTPAGIAPMKPGDVVEVKIEGIGVLRNPVVAPQ